MIPLFDWLAQRPKCFKNCVTKNPELFQDIPNLAEDFDSPICLTYTTAKIVSIFKNVIPCSWQRYCFWQRSLWSLSKRKGKFFICHALLWSYFLYHVGHALLHFAMLLLTKSTPKTRILSSIIHSPCFGDRKVKFTIHLSLLTVTIHPLLFMTLFTPNFCLFKGGCPLCLKQVLVEFISGLLS